jgi:Na+/glutamate symporter
MLSVIPHRHTSTPLAAITAALPDAPWRNGHGHTRTVAIASATAGLVVGAAACAGAVVFTHRRRPAADGSEEPAPDGTEA